MVLWDPPNGFLHAHLREMNDADVMQFITNWHNAIINKIADERKRKSFIVSRDTLPVLLQDPSRRVMRELSGTPLLCALICAIHHREEGLLPTTRVKLYDKCCYLLAEERDEKRRIHKPEGPVGKLNIDLKLMILRRLAWNMMINENGGQGRQQIEAKREDAEHWVDQAIATIDHAHEASKCNATELIDYLVERTGLLRKPAEGFIDFPHRSFQEYLAACAAGSQGVPGDLASKAGNDQWHETILLAAGTNVGGVSYGNSLIEKLLEQGIRARSLNDTAKSQACFALAVGCLSTGGPEIRVELRERALSHLKDIPRPHTIDAARMLSAAGERILEHLKYKSRMSVEEGVACVRCISLVGGSVAKRMLLGKRSYGGDNRVNIQAEILRYPGIEMWDIPSICKVWSPEKGAPRTVARGVKRMIAPDRYSKSKSLCLDNFEALAHLDVSQLKELESVRMSECHSIKSIDFTDQICLREIKIRNCSALESVDVSQSQNLHAVFVRMCRNISLFSIPENVKITSLVLESCDQLFPEFYDKFADLRYLRAEMSMLNKDLSLNVLQSLRCLELVLHLAPSPLVIPFLPHLESLLVEMGSPGEVIIPTLPMLRSIDVSSNYGRCTLIVNKLPSLQTVYASLPDLVCGTTLETIACASSPSEVVLKGYNQRDCLALHSRFLEKCAKELMRFDGLQRVILAGPPSEALRSNLSKLLPKCRVMFSFLD